MRAALNNNPSLCDELIPDYTLGCRRLTPGEGYLESFLLDTVTLEKSPIARITETGITTASGMHHELDVIVCATGFDVSHVPHYPVTGRNGTTLASLWSSEPESYLSVACPDMPNYFIFTGPNATVGHGTLLTSMTWTAEYIVKWLGKMAGEGIKSVAPTREATDEFVRYGDEVHRTLTWTGGCKSWYKNHRVDGRVTATWPGSALLYREVILREIRVSFVLFLECLFSFFIRDMKSACSLEWSWLIIFMQGEDFDIRYQGGNRWQAILGNGFTELEIEAEEKEKKGETVDLAFYI